MPTVRRIDCYSSSYSLLATLPASAVMSVYEYYQVCGLTPLSFGHFGTDYNHTECRKSSHAPDLDLNNGALVPIGLSLRRGKSLSSSRHLLIVLHDPY